MHNEHIFSWLPQDDELNEFYNGVAKFVEAHIHLPKIKDYEKSKEILDPCVGYVKLNSWEVAILDTALFQRLRKITQLGLAYLVYPTLRYSRFEHTIGVIGRLNSVLQSLKEKHHIKDKKTNKEIKLEEILDEYETHIRLAALFHDVGHCIFSHLSEDVINQLPGADDQQRYPKVDRIKEIFNTKFTKGHANLSIAEIFSITILGMRKTAEVLIRGNIYVESTKQGKKVRTAEQLAPHLNHVARFIAGMPVETDPRTIFLAQLISSGLDVDKLDYMSREEHFSGIKIEMDLERIFNKIKLFHITDENNLPTDLLKYSQHLTNKNNFIVLGIEKGGQFSYEEFCVARLALYEKIYLHKKVRAAEALLKKKLKRLYQESTELCLAHNWLYLTESLLEYRHPFMEEVAVRPKAGELNFETIAKVNKEIAFDKLLLRDIPYRAFGFGPANCKTDFILSDYEVTDSDEHYLTLNSIKLWNELNPNQNFERNKPDQVDEFTKAIVAEAINLLSVLKAIASPLQEKEELLELFNLTGNSNLEHDTDLLKNISDQINENLIVDVPNYRRVQLKYESLNFEEASYQAVRWTIPIDQIARYYQLHRILAYVYAENEYCALIYLATERVVYDYLQVSGKLIYDQTQVVPKEIHEYANTLKDYLILHGHYAAFPDLQEAHLNVLSAAAKNIIRKVAPKLNQIMYFNKAGLNFLHIETFIKQFSDSLQPVALDMLNCIEVLKHDELFDEIEAVVREIKAQKPELANIGILPLGGYMGSSSYMMKEFKTHFKQLNITPLNFSSPESFKKIDHILIMDDNINTGRQALNIIAKMIDADPTKYKAAGLFQEKIHSENGEGERISNIDIKAHFEKTPLTFVFITGHEQSAKDLKRFLHEYLDLTQRIEVRIKHQLTDNDRPFSGLAGTTDFIDSVSSETAFNNSVFRRVKENFKHSPTKIKELKNFLELVGAGVIRDRGIIKAHKEQASHHSLGYCNRESLVVFRGSVPTMTVTALWCSGEYFDEENHLKTWKALIERPSEK